MQTIKTKEDFQNGIKRIIITEEEIKAKVKETGKLIDSYKTWMATGGIQWKSHYGLVTDRKVVKKK